MLFLRKSSFSTATGQCTHPDGAEGQIAGSGCVVGKQEVSNSQEKWIISVFKKPLGSVP
jgi:hypothetical protein